jgi:uridine kinase
MVFLLFQYQDAESDIRLMRRIVRDTQERGRTVDEVIHQYHTTVRPMHDEWVVRVSVLVNAN